MRPRNLILILALALCGCACQQATPVASYIAPGFRDVPRRVVVVPFDAPVSADSASALLTQSAAVAMQDLLHIDVVTASTKDERLAAEAGLWRSGRYDVSSLIEARRFYLADAFLFGAITQYKPYEPPLVGLKLRLIDAANGNVIWAAEGLFDARNQALRDQAVRFYKESGLRERLYGPDLMFMSPKQFSTFVAYEMVCPLAQEAAVRSMLAQRGNHE